MLLQLHGLTDNYQRWVQRSNILRHAAPYPMVIAFPDGGTHFYTNWKSSGRLGKARYADVIINDITAHLKRHFHVTDGPWAIGGLSMGGYGSLKWGLKYPDCFASIYAHSLKLQTSDTGMDLSLLEDPDDIDLLTHARRVQESERKPVISFDCGTEDGLLEENR